MSTLYELTAQHRELLSMDDIDPETLADTLEGLEGSIQDKAQNIVAVRSEMENTVTAIDTEIARLSARKTVIKNREVALRNYLKTNMQASEIKKIECPLFTITLAKGRDVVHIEHEDSLPDEYLNAKTVITPDKKQLLADLKKGVVIEGARLIKSDDSVRIK